MSKVEVVYNTENNYCHYPSQYAAQRAYVELNCRDNTLSSTYFSEIGNGTSMDCFHSRAFLWNISPYMKVSAINDLLEKLESLAQEILDGYTEKYNGSNYVGVLSEAAEDSKDAIEKICDEYASDPSNMFNYWSWDEWLRHNNVAEDLKDFSNLEDFEEKERSYMDEEDLLEGELIDYLSELIENANTEEELKKYPSWIWELPRIQESLSDGWDEETVSKFVK
jgi:hypothetical protein